MAYKLGKSECPYPSRGDRTGYSERRQHWWAGWLESRTVSDEAKRKRRRFSGSLLGAFCAVLLCCSPTIAQEEAAALVAPATEIAEAAAPQGSAVRPTTTPQSFKLSGLRKRIFTDRDAERYRVDEESVFAALEAAKASGDITDDMSIVEKARVIFKHLQTKPENATAFAPLAKAKTLEERLTSIRDIASAVKAIIRILELFESVFGEL